MQPMITSFWDHYLLSYWDYFCFWCLLTIPENQWQQDDKDEVDIQEEEWAQAEPAVGRKEQEEGAGVSVLESVKLPQELLTHSQGSDWLESHQSVRDVGEDRTLGWSRK